jgi:mono/diheme cytochrome c family protein
MALRVSRFSIVAASALLLAAVACSHPAQQISKPAGFGTDDSAVATSAAAASRGARVFAAQCAACHGANGSGGPIGPSLVHERAKKDTAAVIAIVKNPTNATMPKLFPAQLSAQDVADVAAYVETL